MAVKRTVGNRKNTTGSEHSYKLTRQPVPFMSTSRRMSGLCSGRRTGATVATLRSHFPPLGTTAHSAVGISCVPFSPLGANINRNTLPQTSFYPALAVLTADHQQLLFKPGEHCLFLRRRHNQDCGGRTVLRFHARRARPEGGRVVRCPMQHAAQRGNSRGELSTLRQRASASLHRERRTRYCNIYSDLQQ